MTPRPRSAQKYKFSSPFKGGVRPVGLTGTGSVSKEGAVKEVVSVGKGKGKESVAEVTKHAVFDLKGSSYALSLPDG